MANQLGINTLLGYKSFYNSFNLDITQMHVGIDMSNFGITV